MRKLLTLDTFIDKASHIHKNKYDYSKVIYITRNKPVEISCYEHGSFFLSPKYHLNGTVCPQCGKSNRLKIRAHSQEFIIQKFKDVHGDTYDYSLVFYKNYVTKVKIRCKEHGIFELTPKLHIYGSICPLCSARRRSIILHNKLGKKNIIEEFKKIHFDLYDYSKVNYIDMKKKVCIICKKHGEFFQNPDSHLSGCGCPKCKSSKGEIKIRTHLNNFKINFIEQKRFEECKFKKSLPFDFYLPDYNLCIEYDGKQHYNNDCFYKGSLLQDIQRNDTIKNNFCKNNNINLLRIPYWEKENIEKIIKEELQKLITSDLIV